MESFTFTTDHAGENLGKPVTLLVADAGLVRARTSGRLRCFVHDDATGKWEENLIQPKAPRAFVRAFGFHRDAETRIDHLLAATGAGEVYRSSYDPEALASWWPTSCRRDARSGFCAKFVETKHQWHHLAGTCDYKDSSDNSLKRYLDGALFGTSKTQTDYRGVFNFGIGTNYGPVEFVDHDGAGKGTHEYFRHSLLGMIDEARQYEDIALSPEQIQQLTALDLPKDRSRK